MIEDLLDRAFADPQPVDRLGLSLACVVVRDGAVIAERYGSDATATTPLISWSMAKSFTHALVGILVGEGRLDPAAPAPVPEWQSADDPRRHITLDHLLTMKSGLTFVEDYVDDSVSHCLDMLFGSGNADMGAYAAALPLEHRPGTVHNYSSGTTNIICRLLADLVGRGDDFEAWMRGALLDPLGMQSARLTFDGRGTWVGSSFLHATAREFARFGELYLRDGVWEGRRLLPEGWVEYGHTPSGTSEDGRIHGAHWWVWDPQRPVYAAQGYECQRIVVVPDSGTVVVRLGKTPVEIAPNVDAWLWDLLAACD